MIGLCCYSCTIRTPPICGRQRQDIFCAVTARRNPGRLCSRSACSQLMFDRARRGSGHFASESQTGYRVCFPVQPPGTELTYLCRGMECECDSVLVMVVTQSGQWFQHARRWNSTIGCFPPASSPAHKCRSSRRIQQLRARLRAIGCCSGGLYQSSYRGYQYLSMSQLNSLKRNARGGAAVSPQDKAIV